MTTALETAVDMPASAGGEGFAIEVERLTVAYGGSPAVHDLSMRVPYGCIYGLVGPSGAGKTVTLRTLAALQPPDSGTALLDGIDVGANPAAVRARVGYLPDAFGMYESLTVVEYLEFYGAAHLRAPPRRLRQILEEILELINLTGRRDSPVGALSRGMRQQLAVGRCLIHDPRILLLDEPASGMDPLARAELLDVLRELGSLGKTILITSHMLRELNEICTHLGIMQAGALIAEGPIDLMAGVGIIRLHIRLRDAASLEAARRVLEAEPACRHIDSEDDMSLVADLSGSDAQPPGILARLVEDGVTVTEFGVERQTIEDIFRRAMRRDEGP